MNREQLIEKAAKALQAHTESGISWEESTEYGRNYFRADVATVLAVFEEANMATVSGFPNTPTDDERVSIASLIRSFDGWSADEVARYPHAASAVIADLTERLNVALHRTVQGEPHQFEPCAALCGGTPCSSECEARAALEAWDAAQAKGTPDWRVSRRVAEALRAEIDVVSNRDELIRTLREKHDRYHTLVRRMRSLGYMLNPEERQIASLRAATVQGEPTAEEPDLPNGHAPIGSLPPLLARPVQGEPTAVRALLDEADALVASWDRKGSWSSDSPVGMVMQLAAALRAAAATEGGER